MSVAAGTGIRGIAGAIGTKNVLIVNDIAAALVVGRAYIIDLADAGANIPTETVFVEGSTDGDPTVYINGVGASTGFGIWVVALETAADQALTLMRLIGIVEGLNDGTGCAQGDALAVDASGDFDATVAAQDGVPAIALEDGTASVLSTMLFNGLYTFHTV